MGWTVRNLIAGRRRRRKKRHFSSPKLPDWLWSPPCFLLNGYRMPFLWVKAAAAWSWPLTCFLILRLTTTGTIPVLPVSALRLGQGQLYLRNGTKFVRTMKTHSVPDSNVNEYLFSIFRQGTYRETHRHSLCCVRTLCARNTEISLWNICFVDLYEMNWW